MISDFIINASMLISFIFLWHHVLRNNTLSFNSPLKIKIYDGVLAGCLGLILMHYSIQANEITILDLRHIPILIVAIYGGAVPAVIGAIVISIGRFYIGLNISSLTSLFMMLTISIGAGLISKYIAISFWKKWTIILIFGQAVFSIAIFIVIDKFNTALHFSFFHSLASILGGYIAIAFIRYLRKNTEMYKKYKEEAK